MKGLLCRSRFNSFLYLGSNTIRNFRMETSSVNRKRLSTSCPDDPNSKKIILETERVKRKKVAMLLSYSGVGYLGMQRNPGMKTIEEDLLQALFKSGYITEEAFVTPQTIQFQRAARTDKGVSAARQVISAKLPEEINVSSINEHLPDQIRVMSVVRTTKGFNSKSNCNARTYSYTLPTFAFTPPGESLEDSFRMSSEVVAKVNETLKLFEGTHNFHNFTSRKRSIDPSAHRYIMKFECEQPFVCDNMELAVIKVKGQSFMLHQIRKMVGLTVAVCRGHTTADTIEKAWKSDRLDIPVAPGLGLVLDEVHYDHYNQRYGNDGIHDLLDWASVEEQICSFKEKHILPTIVKTEKEEKSMYNWLITLPLHSYDIREDNVVQEQEKLDNCDSQEDKQTVKIECDSQEDKQTVKIECDSQEDKQTVKIECDSEISPASNKTGLSQSV